MSNRAEGNRYGPSATQSWTTIAPATASAEATSRVSRQGRAVTPETRWGVAEPTVSAPTRMPMASPRPSRNHVDMIFMAGGYAPARHTPVANRRMRAGPRLETQRASAALVTAPNTIPIVITLRAEKTSGRLVRALSRVPTMNPACTAIVRPAAPPTVRSHSRLSAGSTADALNQSESASSSASESSVSWRQARVTRSLLDDSLASERRDVGGGHPEILQHVVGVLVGHRRRAPDRSGRLGELDRDTDLPHAPLGRVLDVDDHAAVVDLGVGDHLGDVVDLADADVGLHEELVPLVAVARLDQRLDLAPRGLFLGVGRAHELIGRPRETLEVGPPDRVAEVLPEPRLGAADRQELSVPRLVDRVVGIRAAQEALAAARGQAVAEEEAHVGRRRQQGHGRVEIGHVDVLTAAGPLAGEERHHDAERPVQARAGVVGDQVERDDRLSVLLADQVQDAGEREVVHVVRRTIAIRPVLAEAGERAVDEPRIQLVQGLVVGAQALHHAGPEALHEHVGRCGELLEHRLPLGGFHVEGHRALVAVDEGVDRAADPLVARVAVLLGRLDLENLGAHVGQHHRRQLGRRHARQLENPDSVEYAHGGAPLYSRVPSRREVSARILGMSSRWPI